MDSWSVIFDWDGVIVDSSRLHEQAWHQIARETSRYAPPSFFTESFGMKNDKVITELLHWTKDPKEVAELSDLKEETFRRIAQADGLPVLPGVDACLEALRDAGVSCAIGSSAPHANIEFLIDRINLRPFFKAVVCGEDVLRGKPNPEVFLTAAARLGAPPPRCAVIEDAHVGIEAARAAGMKVVAVTTTHPAESLEDADLVLSGLDGNTPAWIGDLFTPRRVMPPAR